ncbi:hypothetical protein UPYG_G00012990 [Umbra pygmaea]|uniref:Bactericidal permeability-increasing protein n=1 Tax=Umbra pygmaea TaxID=75934 RepID=A0ABD0XJ04_UMBPY
MSANREGSTFKILPPTTNTDYMKQDRILSMLPLIILLLTCINHAFGINPAIKAILTNKGLQYGSHVGTDWMHEKIMGMSIPDVSGGVDIGIGTVSYHLDGMSVTQCDIPAPSVKFSEGTGLQTIISGLSISVRGNWQTGFGIIHDGGSFDLAVFNMDLTSLVQLGSDDKGHMSIISKYCLAGISYAKIYFHGGASFIFQPFVDHFEGRIKDLIEEKICPMVDQHVADLEGLLANMQVAFQINPLLVLDIPLTSPPLIDPLNLGVNLKGEIYSVQQPTEPPFEGKAFDLPKDEGFMFLLGLSEFPLNSASYAYFSTGYFQTTITDKMIPDTFPFHLNTSTFGPFIPQLPKLFPNMLMELQLYARQIPKFSFLRDVVTLEFLGAIKTFAIQPNASHTPLFQLNADSNFSGKVNILEGKLHGLMNLSNFTLTLASSEIGPFQTAALESAMKTVMKMSVLSKLNAKLMEGIALPTIPHLRLVKSVLKVQQGFMLIASDIEVSSDFIN